MVSGGEFMSETTRMTVPLTGEHVDTSHVDATPAQQPERQTGFVNGVYQPPEGRQSLHRIRMSRPPVEQVETAPVWVENRGGGGRFEHRPVERQVEPSSPPQPSASDALTKQVGDLTNVVTLLARRVAGDAVVDDGPRMPNAAMYDFFDPQSEGEFYQAMNEYV